MSSAERRFPVHRLPSDRTVARAKSRLLWRYRIPEEADDLVSDALMALLIIPDERIADPDGLFLRIVDRRAQDLIARRRRASTMRRLLAAAAVTFADPSEQAADLHLRAKAISRLRFPGVSTPRLLALFRAIARGASPDAALRSERIPTGSRSRYRAALRKIPQLLDRFAAKRVQSLLTPSNDL
jgi:hypothetical protein